MKKALVTGGAGFIGSHVVDALMRRGIAVCVFDNFSAGAMRNLKRWRYNSNLAVIKGDLLKSRDLAKLEHDTYDAVFHMAANPEVRVGTANPNVHFQQNLAATQNLLEYLRKALNTHVLVFASTSTVYGDVTKVPTPEDYSPLYPISIYGATKLACEALITAYANTYGSKALIYRLANIVGPRSRHGVIFDFIQKLKKNSDELEILGDGTQTKSYLYVNDCVEAALLGLERTNKQVDIYNVGSEDKIDVKTIANTVMQEMRLKNVKLRYTGGVDGGRGWVGDVKSMLLDVKKMKSIGWKPKLDSQQAVRKTVREMLAKQ